MHDRTALEPTEIPNPSATLAAHERPDMPNPSSRPCLPLMRGSEGRQEDQPGEEEEQRGERRPGDRGALAEEGACREAEAPEEGLTERVKLAELQRLLASPSGGWRITEMTSTHAALPALIRLALAALDEYELMDEPSEELEEAIAAIDFTGARR